MPSYAFTKFRLGYAYIYLALFFIRHEVVNLDLKNKPEWHFKLNPAGKVPILQQDDKLVCESLIVAEYLDEAYGQSKLLPTDPYLKAKDKMFIEVGSSVSDACQTCTDLFRG